mmetsp:Transcript_19356/g.58499  ORF Transcript_19356/g.58499 Transcript_19356/m.58499 type:complete len:197 (+) Transcript_19356:222-812(+)
MHASMRRPLVSPTAGMQRQPVAAMQLQQKRSLQQPVRVASIQQTSIASLTERKNYFDGPDKRPIILFDGVCNVCNTGVDVALSAQQGGEQMFRFAPLQSEAGRELLQQCGRATDDISSIVLVEPHQHSIKSEAILRIGTKMRAPLGQLAVLGFAVPKFVRDVLYDQVANNRYTVFGKRKDCRVCDGKLKGADYVTK